MILGRLLTEELQTDILDWLSKKFELVVIEPWTDPEKWSSEVSQVEAVITRKGKITEEQIEKSKGRLKVIARTGVGVDPSRVNLKAAKKYNVLVTNMPGCNAVSVAELVFGQMVAIVRHTHEANRTVRENHWGEYIKHTGIELAGKTIGIIGMGNVGTRVAIRAKAFEMNICVYDPYIPASHVTALGGDFCSLHELLTKSDFITLHCPLTEETINLIDENQFKLMKSSSYIINTARGGIINEQALYTVLRNKKIAGAALDVIDVEPPEPNHPLLQLDTILWTPHLGAVTIEASKRGEWGAAEEVVRVLEGKLPKNPVTLEY